MKKFLIISDSGCDLRKEDFVSDTIDFAVVPLIIEIDGSDHIDNEGFDTNNIIDAIRSKMSIKTACPSPEAYAELMRQYDNVICITMSSKLSGSYNSARLAMEMVKGEHPEKNIFVLDSLTASAAMVLIVLKLKEIIESTTDFDTVVKKIVAFKNKVKIRFILQNFDILVKTGRIGAFAAKIASILSVKLICGDDGEGNIKMFNKALGTKRSLNTLSQCLVNEAQDQGEQMPIVITHCGNEEDASLLKSILESNLSLCNIKTYLMRGIASVYSSDKGICLAF